MDTFALFTAKAWIKNGVEVIEYGGETDKLRTSSRKTCSFKYL